jgi:hypothetical protein
VKFLAVWSRSRFGEWLIERSYAERYVRDVLRIPAGSGRVGDDGRYYIALPQGVCPSPLVAHPAAASGEVAIPLVSRRAAS